MTKISQSEGRHQIRHFLPVQKLVATQVTCFDFIQNIMDLPLASNTWTILEVSNWLVSVDLATLVPVFKTQGIDGYALLNLNNDDFDQLGIKIGQRKKLEAKILLLKSQTPDQGN